MSTAPTPIRNLTRPSDVPSSDYQNRVLGWASEAIQEADAFLRSQPNYLKIGETVEAINGEYEGRLDPALSSTSANHLSRIALVLASGLTDVKPFWDVKTANKRYEETAQNLNKLGLHWWLSRFIDQRHADAIKYALAAGSSYLHLFYNDQVGDIDAQAEDPRDVLPIRPADYVSIQNALGVAIRRERTVNYVKKRYPWAASYIQADRDGAYARSTGPTRAGRILAAINQHLSPFHEVLFQGERAHLQMAVPTVDLFTLYVKDDTRNASSMPLMMGEKIGSGPNDWADWSYLVPAGAPKYPHGRMIIFTRTVILWDGPNIFWHGLFPVCKLTLDPWPWTWLGKSPLWDLLPLQRSLDRNLRAIDDHNEKVAHPGLIADKNSVSRAALARMNTRRPGFQFQHNPLAGKGIQIVQEPPLDPTLAKYPDWLIDQMEKISGARDLSSLFQMGQIPSADTLEKILQTLTPPNRMRSRSLEAFTREFGMMTISNFLQFYTAPIRAAILGPGGILPEDFDFDPGTLIPDFTQDRDFDGMGNPTPEALSRGPLPRADRARAFLRYFTFYIAPSSLLNSASVDRKMLYLQLARAGLIDHWTLLEILEIPNVGSPPEGANTITDRLTAEAERQLQMNISPVGRKASGQAPPRLTMKES